MAALSSSGGASLPRVDANAIWPRSRSTWACWSSVSGPASAMARSRSAASTAPAWRLASCRGERAPRRGAWARASAPPRVRGRPRPRPSRRGPAPAAERSSSAATSSSDPGVAWARCQARRSGSTSGSVASASAPCTACLLLRPTPRDTPPSGPAGDETHARADREQAVGLRSPPAARSRAAPPPATPAPDHRPARPPRPASSAGSRPAGALPAAESCPRCGPTVPARPANRTRPPAPPASTRAATPTAPAGCHASQRRSAPAPGHPAAHAAPSSSKARASPSRRPSTTSRGNPVESLRSAHASRTPARPTPPTAGAPRTRAPAPKPDQATARHRPHTRAAAPRPPPRTGSARPARPGTDPARSPLRSPNATPSASRWGAGSRVQAIQHRRAQLLQRRERELHL